MTDTTNAFEKIEEILEWLCDDERHTMPSEKIEEALAIIRAMRGEVDESLRPIKDDVPDVLYLERIGEDEYINHPKIREDNELIHIYLRAPQIQRETIWVEEEKQGIYKLLRSIRKALWGE